MPVVERARATHTTLECHDVAESLRFYRDVLGLSVNQIGPLVGHVWGTNGHYAAALQSGVCVQQPLTNFYARPVPTAADVDRAHERILAARAEHAIRDVTDPRCEDPAKFGVGTYGFYVNDRDGNWWRVEENGGPFGPAVLGAPGAEGPIVQPGPISYVVLESQRIAGSVRFYREVLGMDVRQPEPHYGYCQVAAGIVNVVLVEVGDRLVPQKISNHHGLTIDGSPAAIDALRRALEQCAAEFGIRRVLPATRQHGSYAFYMQDLDTNCWEFEVWDDGVSPVDRALEHGHL